MRRLLILIILVLKTVGEVRGVDVEFPPQNP